MKKKKALAVTRKGMKKALAVTRKGHIRVARAEFRSCQYRVENLMR